MLRAGLRHQAHTGDNNLAAIEGASRYSGSVGDTTHDLYRRYGKQIYAYCFHRLRSKEEAEDAVQTTFMNAFRSLQRGATAEHEQAWLYKIAQNVCIARHTSSSRRLRLESPNDLEVLQEVVPSHEGEEPLELFGIEEALERMPENQRRAILLREWQGLSYREISEQLDLSQAAVEMLIFRARRTLAGALEQPGEEKKRRVGRKVGSLGSILGALKTLLGGGAAIKAAAVAAAAIAVVGEGASHTIIRNPVQKRPAHRARAASQPVAGAVSQSPSHAVAAGRDAGVAVAPMLVQRVQHAAAAHVEPHVSRPAVLAEPAAAPPVVEAPAPVAPPPATTTASAPAPSPPAPAAAPAPAPPAQQDVATKGKDKPKDPTPTPAPVPTPAPIQAAPTTTTTTPTATTPAPAPATDPNPAHGNDGDHGHGKQKDPQPAPAPVVPTPVTVTVVTTPVLNTPVVAAPGNGNGNGKGLGLGRGKQQP